jgi:hypothetical protein
MLQLLLSEWIVRFFLLYLVVAGSVALIRRQQPAECSPFVFLPLDHIREHWAGRGAWCAASHIAWWGQHNLRNPRGIRIGHETQSDDKLLWKRNDGLRYV